MVSKHQSHRDSALLTLVHMLLLALAHPGPLEFVKNLGGSTRTGGESHKKA